MSFENKMAPSISNDVLFPALHRMLAKDFYTFQKQIIGKRNDLPKSTDSGDFISIFGN